MAQHALNIGHSFRPSTLPFIVYAASSIKQRLPGCDILSSCFSDYIPFWSEPKCFVNATFRFVLSFCFRLLWIAENDIKVFTALVLDRLNLGFSVKIWLKSLKSPLYTALAIAAVIFKSPLLGLQQILKLTLKASSLPPAFLLGFQGQKCPIGVSQLPQRRRDRAPIESQSNSKPTSTTNHLSLLKKKKKIQRLMNTVTLA